MAGSMSDVEKLVEAGVKYPDDPLVLRPQVGGDVLPGRPYFGFCWPRSLVLRLMLICVILATISGCILIIFTLRHSAAWPWHRNPSRSLSKAAFCRALTPFPGLDVEERLLYEPTAITITHGSVGEYPPVSVFYLSNDAMAVLRTRGTCYVYPLTREVAEAVPVDETVIDRIKETLDSNMVQFKSQFDLGLFMVSPNADERIQISHPAAAANCSDVPIFRLLEMTFSLDLGQMMSMSPEICSQECPPGESRDSQGVPRQVCRCPPKAAPPANLLQEPFSLLALINNEAEVGEEEEDDEGEAGDSKTGIIVGNESTSNERELARGARSVEALHGIESAMKIPLNCRILDKVIGGALPNCVNHTLPLMVIVQC